MPNVNAVIHPFFTPSSPLQLPGYLFSCVSVCFLTKRTPVVKWGKVFKASRKCHSTHIVKTVKTAKLDDIQIYLSNPLQIASRLRQAPELAHSRVTVCSNWQLMQDADLYMYMRKYKTMGLIVGVFCSLWQ